MFLVSIWTKFALLILLLKLFMGLPNWYKLNSKHCSYGQSLICAYPEHAHVSAQLNKLISLNVMQIFKHKCQIHLTK